PQPRPPRRLQEGALDLGPLQDLGSDELTEGERSPVELVVAVPLGGRLDGVAFLLERGHGIGVPAVRARLPGSAPRGRLRFGFLAGRSQSLEERIGGFGQGGDPPPWGAGPGPGLAVGPRGRGDDALDLLDRAVGLETADADL